MKIGLVSDTHGNLQAVKWVHRQAADVTLWLHAGDYVDDANYLEEISGAGVVKVAGNGDWPRAKEPYATVVEAAGHRIFLSHGHTYGVNYGTERLIEAAMKEGCDVVVYGHTHRVDLTEGENLLILNPGSASRPRDERRPSFMVMELEEGRSPWVKIIRDGDD